MRDSASTDVMSERDRLTADRTANMLARRALLDTESFASEVWRPETYLRSSALGVNGDSEEAVHAAVRVLSATADFSLCEVRKAICRHHHDFFLIADLLKENLDGSVDEMLAKINTIKASSKTLILETLNHTNDLYTSNINHLNLNLKSKQKDLLDQKKKAAAKMLELYETIAGFEWSLLSPKRYVVFEGTGITEIVENHQPKYVTLFLFNDALATASKITGITFSSSLASKRLALDRFWSLEDIQIVDLPDTKSVQNSFKIIKTDEIVLFVAENDTAKRLWMQQIIKTIANLKIKPNSETSIYPSSKVESAQADRNEFAGMFHKSRGPTLSEEVYQMLTSDLSLISERTCLCDFEGAVQLVDKVRFELSSVKNEDHKFDSIGHNYEESVEISNYELCKDKLEHEIDILASFLNHELMHPMLSKDECSTYVRLLFVLGRGEEASERFLASRSELIKDRVKQLRFTGDVYRSVDEHGFLLFTAIQASAERYIAAFFGSACTSSLIFWAQLEIATFVTTICAQLKEGTTASTDIDLFGDCILSARRHCERLQSAGIDLLFYMDELFSVHIESLLRVHSDRIGDIVQQQVLLDDFTVSEMNKLKLCISNSARLADAPSILDTLPETVDQLYEAQSMLGYRKTISKSTKSSPSIAESIPSIESIDNINLKFNESRSFDNVSFKSAASLRRKNMAALESRGADDQDNCFAEVTNSTLSFYTHVFEFLNLVEPMLVAPDSGEPLVKRVCRLFEEHSSSLVKATYQSSLTSETFLKIIGNVYFLVYQLLPSMRQQFFDRFGRAFSDLTRLNARLEATHLALCEMFAKQFGRSTLYTLGKSRSIYRLRDPALTDTASISLWLIDMLPNFCKISREAGAKNRSFVMEALLKFMLGGILDAIEEGRISFDLKSASGPEQLLLDIHFILMGCEPFVTEEVANRATLIIKRVMDSCSDIVDIMHQPGWYDERVRYLLRVNYPMDLGLSKPTK